MSDLPPFASKELVAERLPLIFPEGTPNRTYCTRDLAASAVFVALYIGAVEGSGQFLGPIHVYRMTAEQASKPDTSDRQYYAAAILKRSAAISGTRWYADNTREPIRDETLRDGLVAIGAVTRREDLPTTSGHPRYALKKEFAALFDPALEGASLESAIAQFQSSHLSKSALARVTIMRAGATAGATGVLVTFPSGETRQLAPGPSSFIAKGVVEVFAKNFLEQPAVLWLSESGNKVVVRDDQIAGALNLKIEADKNLPDLILADLGPKGPADHLCRSRRHRRRGYGATAGSSVRAHRRRGFRSAAGRLLDGVSGSGIRWFQEDGGPTGLGHVGLVRIRAGSNHHLAGRLYAKADVVCACEPLTESLGR